MKNSILKKDILKIREFHPELDTGLIISTWLQGLYNGNKWFREIDKDVYFKEYKKIIQGLIKQSDVLIACLQEDDSVILGYSVFKGSVLHYIFCKPIWRKIGIAKSLLPNPLETVTHITTLGLSLLKEKYPYVKFNPFEGATHD